VIHKQQTPKKLQAFHCFRLVFFLQILLYLHLLSVLMFRYIQSIKVIGLFCDAGCAMGVAQNAGLDQEVV